MVNHCLARLRVIATLILLLAGCAQTREPPAVDLTTGHTGGSLVRLHPRKPRVISAGWEGRLAIWTLAGEPVRSWQAHAGTVNGLVFTDSGGMITAGYDAQLVDWTLDGRELRRQATPSSITAATGSAVRDLLLTGHADGWVRIWRLSDLSLVQAQQAHTAAVRAVALHEPSGRMASSGRDGRVVLFSVGEPPQALAPAPTDSRTLAFSPAGHILMGGGWFRLHRWELDEGAFRTIPTPHHGIIKAIRYSKDGRYLATISRQTDSAVLFLDPDTGAVLRRFQKHALCGGDVYLSRDNDFMVTTADDASVRIYHLDPSPEASP